MPIKKKKDEDMKSEDLSSIEPKSKSVWGTLKAISVNDHTEKKNGLTYLSWAWAWGVLKDNYPDATFEKVINLIGRQIAPCSVARCIGRLQENVTVSASSSKIGEHGLFPTFRSLRHGRFHRRLYGSCESVNKVNERILLG